MYCIVAKSAKLGEVACQNVDPNPMPSFRGGNHFRDAPVSKDAENHEVGLDVVHDSFDELHGDHVVVLDDV